jgi:hypothetical protein
VVGCAAKTPIRDAWYVRLSFGRYYGAAYGRSLAIFPPPCHSATLSASGGHLLARAARVNSDDATRILMVPATSRVGGQSRPKGRVDSWMSGWTRQVRLCKPGRAR